MFAHYVSLDHLPKRYLVNVLEEDYNYNLNYVTINCFMSKYTYKIEIKI